MRITKALITTSLAAAFAGAPLATAAENGGSASSAAPQPRSVGCSERCAALDAAQPGSVVRIYGRDFEQVGEVIFLGGKGAADDVSVTPSKVRSRTVYARVPPAAIGGPLQLVNVDGTASAPTAPLDIDHGATKLAASDTRGAIDARVEFRRAYFDGKQPAEMSYLVRGSRPIPVTVTLVRAGTETVVGSWSAASVEPGTVQRIRWNGIDAATKRAATRGRYEFRVYSGVTRAQTAQASPRPNAALSFLFLDNQFPVSGRHSYGEGFGAARSDHVHKGQDVMADCGTPLVAARGGVVRVSGFERRAGYNVVIDAAGSGYDYVYMHMRDQSPLRKGQRVRTGDPIGFVGRSGDATACHLHFELWSAPGWYTGGRPVAPTPFLRSWDQYS